MDFNTMLEKTQTEQTELKTKVSEGRKRLSDRQVTSPAACILTTAHVSPTARILPTALISPTTLVTMNGYDTTAH